MQVNAGGLTLEAEVHGPVDGPPLLLIMGLGMQLLGWPDGLVAQFVERGFRVIRFDNRDVGLSQRFTHLGQPNVFWQGLRYGLRLPLRAPYTLAEMAADSAHLLDALGVASAHVCGVSMGGMIAQRLALAHPKRVSSLTLVMTTSGSRALPGPTREARAMLLAKPAAPTREAMVARFVQLFRVIGSPDYPTPDAELQAMAAASIDRGGLDASGTVRQLLAIAADGDRTRALAALRVPTEVVHGEADPLLPLACGQQLARAIPDARLHAVPGLGHDLPAPLWGLFADAVERVSLRAA